MSKESTTASCCTSLISEPSRFNRLARAASTFDLTSTLARIAAASLVTASAGLGAVYAWSVGSEHGAILAVLFVLFAVGLEIAKPLSVVAAFRSLGSWQLVRGGVLAILAFIAIAYSLSAELSLMAGSRGDVVAERQAALDHATDTAADAKRARERYDVAKGELATLPTSRLAAELQAEIDGLLLTPGADGCATINGKVTRDVCPQVAALRIEKARSDRRAELEAIMATPLPVIAPTATRAGTNVKDADPGASALSTYLAALGFVLPATLLSDWLALVPVVALELGSALAGILVQACLGPRACPTAKFAQAEPVKEPIQTTVPVEVGQVGHSKQTTGSDDVAQEAARVKNAILDQLKERGGEVDGSQRGLAALIGTSRPTVRRAINGLMVAGLIAAEATRNGTVLRLVA